MADEQVQAVGDQMPRVRVLLQQAVARYILRTGHPAWVLMPEHFKGGPCVSLRFIEETRPDFGEQVLVGHGADEETAARDLIAKLGYTVDRSPEKAAAVRARFGMGPEPLEPSCRVECGACAGQFYTGSAMGDHTCKPSRVVPIELAELKDTIIAKLIGEKTALAARLEAVRLVVNELRAKWYSEEGRASLALIASELDRNAG